MTESNSSFSKRLPGLQLGIDSTSLGTFKECPRKYYYSIVLGLQPRETSVHLTFGLALHRAREVYEHTRTNGADHEESLRIVIRDLLISTWDKDLGRPKVLDHKTKHRLGLVRSVVWYLDRFGKDDPIETVIKADGKPAVELSFRFDSGFASRATGEPIVFCGHLDRLGLLNGVAVVPDIKTTSYALDSRFFNSFTPGNQFSMYALAAKVVFAFPVEKIIVDGVRILADSTEFMRAPVERPTAVLEEWHEAQGKWLRMMEVCAVEGGEDLREAAWPQNDKSCTMYGGCPFQGVCGKSPAARPKWLKSEFRKRVWDPLQVRGEI